MTWLAFPSWRELEPCDFGDAAAKAHVANDDVVAARHGDLGVGYGDAVSRSALAGDCQVAGQGYITLEMMTPLTLKTTVATGTRHGCTEGAGTVVGKRRHRDHLLTASARGRGAIASAPGKCERLNGLRRLSLRRLGGWGLRTQNGRRYCQQERQPSAS